MQCCTALGVAGVCALDQSAYHPLCSCSWQHTPARADLGCVPRSLKPENMIFQAKGRRWDAQRGAWLPSTCKVVDYGGARALCPDTGSLKPGQAVQCAPVFACSHASRQQACRACLGTASASGSARAQALARRCSHGYAPPELYAHLACTISEEAACSLITAAADSFSVGCLAHELFTLEGPSLVPPRFDGQVRSRPDLLLFTCTPRHAQAGCLMAEPQTCAQGRLLDRTPEGMPESLEVLWRNCSLEDPAQRWSTGEALAWVQLCITGLTEKQ